MKKFLAILMVALLSISLVACSGSKEEPESVTDKVKDEVKYRIMATIAVQYETTGVPNITYYVDEMGDNTYEVTGKVSVKDKYGDTYTGKYDAVVEYDPAADDCSIDSFSLGSLYKD